MIFGIWGTEIGARFEGTKRWNGLESVCISKAGLQRVEMWINASKSTNTRPAHPYKEPICRYLLDSTNMYYVDRISPKIVFAGFKTEQINVR